MDDRLDTLQQISQRKLIEILDSISGKKDLIIEPKLMKLLECFIGVTALRFVGIYFLPFLKFIVFEREKKFFLKYHIPNKIRVDLIC